MWLGISAYFCYLHASVAGSCYIFIMPSFWWRQSKDMAEFFAREICSHWWRDKPPNADAFDEAARRRRWADLPGRPAAADGPARLIDTLCGLCAALPIAARRPALIGGFVSELSGGSALRSRDSNRSRQRSGPPAPPQSAHCQRGDTPVRPARWQQPWPGATRPKWVPTLLWARDPCTGDSAAEWPATLTSDAMHCVSAET